MWDDPVSTAWPFLGKKKKKKTQQTNREDESEIGGQVACSAGSK